MSGSPLRYALVTPARDERENLARLAVAVDAQTIVPEAWLIVDDGSTDGTGQFAHELAARLAYVRVVDLPTTGPLYRGAPIVRAFHCGLEALGDLPDVVVKLDADVSFEPDHFERLLDAFREDERLGIASGSAWELVDGAWRQQFMTGDSVWGAARAYRRDCLPHVLPLEERMGWDGIDALKAAVAGWKTRTLLDLPFRHHRREGERDGRRAAWRALGRCAHFMGYRPSYQLVRTLHHVRRDPAAVGLLTGYAVALLAHEPQCSDRAVIAYLRDRQRLRSLIVRRREALGLRAGAPT
jgi:biofilm PGA synthesis N-glycosyltransferase PgaC